MLQELTKKASLFSLLHRIDLDLAHQCRLKKCPHCGGVLHTANYPRQPWDAPAGISEDLTIRQSLCCAQPGCRKRTLPPSTIFFGRKKYWSAIIVVVMALRQKPNGWSTAKLVKMFGITRNTIKRWIVWFKEVFPVSDQWRRLRGLVCSSVSSQLLPGSLLNYFIGHLDNHEEALIGCLRFLATGFG